MSAPAIMFTGMICLYSTGHWIGGTEHGYAIYSNVVLP
jgi:hypothetical protein